MIVGNGMIAKAFSSYFRLAQDVVIFASGVSNSVETNPLQYKRELNLLAKTCQSHPGKLLVYFSTCSISDPDRADTPYVIHKREIETELASWAGSYLILRLPVVIGRTNLANTFPYFLYAKINSGERFDVWSQAVRYPIDIDNVIKISRHIISDSSRHNQIINVALRPYPVMDIVREMELIMGKSAIINVVDRGCVYDIERNLAVCLAHTLNIDLGKEYLARVLRKYFT